MAAHLMRPPRPGSGWSLRRLQRRIRYAAYMASPAWLARRQAWYAEHVQVVGAEPVCAVCGRAWRLDEDDLHHATYTRLGAEAHTDLIPLCREHHQALHDMWDAYPAWRRLGLHCATSGIIASLRHHTIRSGAVARSSQP